MMPIVKWVMRRFPRVVEAMAKRHIGYNKQLEHVRAQQAAGKAFLIYPKEKLPIGHVEHDPEVLRRAYNIGVARAEEILPELRVWLAQE